MAGYWTRVVVVKQPDNNAAASLSYLLITLAPSFLAAALYMTFGRIIFWVAPDDKRTARYTGIPARHMTTFFVTFDMLGFVISCIGVFILVANASKKELTPEQQINGLNITYNVLRVAFIWQIIAFGIFCVVAFRFMFSSKSWRYDWPNSGTWRKMAWIVNLAAFLITIRSLYRTLAFILNRGDNYARTHEWTFYMFDFLPILGKAILESSVRSMLIVLQSSWCSLI